MNAINIETENTVDLTDLYGEIIEAGVEDVADAIYAHLLDMWANAWAYSHEGIGWGVTSIQHVTIKVEVDIYGAPFFTLIDLHDPEAAIVDVFKTRSIDAATVALTWELAVRFA